VRLAINKPTGISSADVIRVVQKAFKTSKLFQPWLEREQSRKDAESHNQKKKRRSFKSRQPLQVKMGHGGTLDPMATGVLILGVGSGTKELNNFLGCTKSYETTVLFGAATDSYDAVGKVVARKDYQHVTKEKVEEALSQFRGKIMQRPPIFSALRVQGKRLYEYAREGKELPVEIAERPVEVKTLEMLEWMEGGTHKWHWPDSEAPQEEKKVANELLHLENATADNSSTATDVQSATSGAEETKRKREDDEPKADPVGPPSPKRPKSSSEPTAFGALPVENNASETDGMASEHNAGSVEALAGLADPTANKTPCPAPACRLRMTVTSGFYVRSLCHDLGAAVQSLGLMSSLVRSQQGDFKLGENVLEFDDIEKGEDVWSPQVEKMLQEWVKKSSKTA
jgi:tRNA pseudouridine55 synthase